ncbi:tRNA wybutosine-synthesizing protein 3 homolog [Sycon ciliatum]|uniref:tRNA wybutosine-synthesizing protein 3 homolog n=1 Tax=Sycon ciliatum TaxID=27933 RepID=UPI0031F6D320
MDAWAFARAKEQCLSQVDRSKKGSIDEPVAEVVDTLNASDHFFTTSSCSGRVAIFWQGEEDVGCGRRKEGKWLYVSHDPVIPADVVAAVVSCPEQGDAWLKFEPMVLHVQCQSLEAAQKLLVTSLGSGFRNSGIVLGRKQRYIMAVRSTHGMDVPLVISGKRRVSEEYVNLLCDLANDKMSENVQRIDRLLHGIAPLMAEMQSQPLASNQPAAKTKKSRKGNRQATVHADTADACLSSSSPAANAASGVLAGSSPCQEVADDGTVGTATCSQCGVSESYGQGCAPKHHSGDSHALSPTTEADEQVDMFGDFINSLPDVT